MKTNHEATMLLYNHNQPESVMILPYNICTRLSSVNTKVGLGRNFFVSELTDINYGKGGSNAQG
jgi:hypothetical protein